MLCVVEIAKTITKPAAYCPVISETRKASHAVIQRGDILHMMSYFVRLRLGATHLLTILQLHAGFCDEAIDQD